MYLVTGATGNVGSEVTEQLLARGERVRVFTRDAGKVAHWGDRVEVACGDFQKPESFASAIRDVEAAFVMDTGPDVEGFGRLMTAAKAQSEARIVFLSTILAGQPEFKIGSLHKAKENAIVESGLAGRFVRAGGFMTNSYRWSDAIQGEGVVYNALGKGRFAPIAAEDIAAVVVRALTNSEMPGEVFELTGGELVDTAEQVEILGQILGRSIRCVDVPLEAAVQGLIRTGVPEQIAAAVGESLGAVRNGGSTIVTDTVERLTGQRPMTFEAWSRKHAARFAAAQQTA